MTKIIAKFAIIGGLVAILCYAIGLDSATAADVTFGVQCAWLVLRLIPGKVWLAIGEGIADMLPWIMLSLMS